MSAKQIVQTAFGPSHIANSFRSTGAVVVNSVGDVELNIPRILHHCPHYRQLPTADKEKVIQLVKDNFIDLMATQGVIHEEQFEQYLGTFDNGSSIGRQTRTPLNEMGTSRQRAVFVNHELYQAELRARKAKAAAKHAKSTSTHSDADQALAATRKRKRTLKCCNVACGSRKDANVVDLFDEWVACGRCNIVWSCQKKGCQQLLANHQNLECKDKKKGKK